jgi:GNAT superfamily N-acetyltransferase
MTAQDTVSAAAVTVDLVDWDDPDATRLRNAQQTELRDRYGEDDIGHTMTGETIVAMLLVRVDGVPAACGALRDLGGEHGPGTAELKRLYVVPVYRGRGLSRIVVRGLENRASALGFDRLVLETGVLQPEAIGLYLGAGYQFIENFGEYAAEIDSRCLAKDLGAPTSRPPTSRTPSHARPAVTLRAVEWDDQVATRLRREMYDRENLPRYPHLEDDLARHGGYDADDVAQGVGALVNLVAEIDGEPAGCATLRAARPGSPEDSAEVKKLYVQDTARGAGVGRALLAALEDDARGRGLTRIILQTGIRQPEAISLYLSTGYRVIEPFPPHRSSLVSLCFAKDLA